MSQDVNVVALVKGEERYIFLFSDEKKGETLRTLGKYASNPELSFSWYDAAVLSQKVRRAVRKNNANFQNSEWSSKTDVANAHLNELADEIGESDFGGGSFDDEDYREFEDLQGEEPIW